LERLLHAERAANISQRLSKNKIGRNISPFNVGSTITITITITVTITITITVRWQGNQITPNTHRVNGRDGVLVEISSRLQVYLDQHKQAEVGGEVGFMFNRK
jgi:hypothetical protein